MSAEKWEKFKLTELGTLARGKSKHRPRDAAFLYGGKYPFIQTGDVKNANHKIQTYTQTYSEEGLKQSKLWQPGTLCITIAANIADTAILTFPACFPDSVLGFVADQSKCDVDFIEYHLRHIKSEIQSHAIGSVQDNINLGTFEKLELQIPPLPTQRRIAAILTALDDKIELNRRMNETLEGIAQAVWGEWFGKYARGEEELPEGWRWGKLGEVAQTKKGQIRPNEMTDDLQYVGLEHITRKSLSLTDSGTAGQLESNKFRFSKGDLLFGKLRPYFHKVCIAPFDGVCSTDILVIEPKTPEWFAFVVFHFYSDELISFTTATSGGTRMPRTSWGDLASFEIAIPPTELALAFNEFARPIFDKMIENITQLHTLAALRDALLPQLMRGEINFN